MRQFTITYLQEVVQPIPANDTAEAGRRAEHYAKNNGLKLLRVDEVLPALLQTPAA